MTAKLMPAAPEDTILLYLHFDEPARFLPLLQSLGRAIPALEFHDIAVETVLRHPGVESASGAS